MSSQGWLTPGLLAQLWKIGEVKGFLLKTSEIPVATIVTDNAARPCTHIGRTMTPGYIPQSVFHCALKNRTHAAKHHSKLRCFYFQLSVFFLDAPLNHFPFSLWDSVCLGTSHEPLITSPSLLSLALRLPGNEMAENHSWLGVLRGSFGRGNQKALQVRGV